MELEEAFGIMGENALDIDIVEDCLEMPGGKNEAAAFLPKTITKNELVQRKETHILIPPFPVSVLDLLKRFPDCFVCTSPKEAWFRKKPFARKIIPQRWQLIRKDVLADSCGKRYSDQLDLPPSGEAITLANQIVYLICIWYLNRKEILFHKEIRCYDRVEVGGEEYRVIVQSVGQDALKIAITYLGDEPYPNLGITTEFFPSPDS